MYFYVSWRAIFLLLLVVDYLLFLFLVWVPMCLYCCLLLILHAVLWMDVLIHHMNDRLNIVILSSFQHWRICLLFVTSSKTVGISHSLDGLVISLRNSHKVLRWRPLLDLVQNVDALSTLFDILRDVSSVLTVYSIVALPPLNLDSFPTEGFHGPLSDSLCKVLTDFRILVAFVLIQNLRENLCLRLRPWELLL